MKRKLNPGTLLTPLPAVIVSCGTMEKSNAVTVAWTGIINSIPPMLYISLRPERYSYEIIKSSMEFAVNLTTSSLAYATDFCGVKSGRDVDKFEALSLTKEEANCIKAPLIAQSPVSLECKVREIKELGSHHMFIADILCVDAEEKYFDSKGKLNFEQMGLISYSHGTYNATGSKRGFFGFSVAKKKK
jgi:flavin reductase (DIM6/NTAB) family NADH-FMN oxidoreductase RutF